MTTKTRAVLAALVDAGAGQPIYGLQIMKSAQIASGTLYPILDRLEEQGWITGEWEDVNADRSNRPRRRFYVLTGHGARCAAAELARAGAPRTAFTALGGEA